MNDNLFKRVESKTKINQKSSLKNMTKKNSIINIDKNYVRFQ